MYPSELTTPIAKDLTDFGFQGLTTSQEVSDMIENQKGTVLLVVNSVCGCAAANARPGAKIAVSQGKKPDQLITVFAGVDRDAVDKAREYLLPYPPSSPAIALFKDGRLVHMLERRHIEGNSAQTIANNLVQAFETYC
ncbi:MAG: BrxA/BrxB family bacilliredoxin [Saprospiraceae bacterium]|jgi:putative YphP/YqiW family bacilliredoxin|nr:BrxA/BrxB family bacilliredoxin [Saprospiraceae bacterium]MBK7699131.1 BrxA/BrxB family bacilliredoxin [Saprospiraceae bacterium]MBK8825469.1 BrxA/BrxB family bacilliredoxin [Saprospiraceae bacterium]MBK8886506.1 BrxA/BrxB family bacilliredoxin [Saprospiraceae bacterium]MBK9583815.1 BrxA/BrxB family bacilliredoxin [Saprospiraceae bacterium]